MFCTHTKSCLVFLRCLRHGESVRMVAFISSHPEELLLGSTCALSRCSHLLPQPTRVGIFNNIIEEYFPGLTRLVVD